MIEKLQGESAKSYQALQDYWNMGAGRSLKSLIARYQEMESPPTSRYSTLANWSSVHNWKERIEREIIDIANENEEIAQEERAKLYKRQFDIINNALQVEEQARGSINYENMSVAQYTSLINAVHKMLADLRTNDTAKIALTDPDGKRPYEGKVDHESIMAIAARLDKLNEQS